MTAVAPELAQLHAALRYAAAGWPVFPTTRHTPSCGGGRDCACKQPLTTHGFHDATTDPLVIARWWRQWPHANVAVATGTPGPDVLDVDNKPDGNGFGSFNRLKRAGLLTGACAIIQTPSGGLHVYYRASGGGNHTLARHRIDFRGKGGYVVAPPSVVHGNAYEVLDKRAASGRLDWDAVKRLLDPPRPPRPAPAGRQQDAGRGLAEFVAKQTEGNRNAGLYWAACRAVEQGAGVAELVGAAVQAGLSEVEAWRTVRSAERQAQR